MSTITVNTTTLNNYVEDLNAKKNYYSGKQSVFISSNYNATNCPKLANFLKKISNNYKEISENIKNTSEYLEEYYKNVEAVEQRLSEKNGFISIGTVSSLANKYRGSIKKYQVNDESVFLIQKYNSRTSNTQKITNLTTSSTAEEKVVEAIKESGYTSTEDFKEHMSERSFFSKLLDWWNGKSEMKESALPITDSTYTEPLNEYTSQCENTIAFYQSYIDATVEEKAQYDKIETLLKMYQNGYYQEAQEYYKQKALEAAKESGFTSIEEFEQYMNELDAYIEQCNFAIEQVENAKINAKYELLLSMEDYQNFTRTEVNLEKITLDESEGGTALNFSSYYNRYIKENGYVSPMDFYNAMTTKYGNYQIELSWDYTKQVDQFEEVAKAAKIDPELGKMYAYIYEKFGKEYADEYLYNYEPIANQIVGMKEAESILATLKTEEDVQNALENHLKVTGQGLLDGVETFGAGVKNAFSLIPSLFGVVPSRSYSADEYASMYLLSALQGEDSPYAGMFLSNNYEISQGIGNMLPSMALSYFCPILGSTALGVSAGGNSYHSSLVEGYSNIEALTYGVISGASEAITEKMLGGIPGIGSDIKVNSVKTFFESMLKEGGEEAFQEVFDTYVRLGVFGENVDYNELLENMKKSALYGGITAGILQAPGAVYNSVNTSAVKKAYKNGSITETDIRNTLDLANIDTKNMTVDQMIQEHFDVLRVGLNDKIITKSNTEQVEPASKSTIEQWNTTEPLKPVSDQIDLANYYTAKGQLLGFTVEMESISDMTPELLSKIDDPSVVSFRVGDKTYSYPDMKQELGMVSKVDTNTNRTMENIPIIDKIHRFINEMTNLKNEMTVPDIIEYSSKYGIDIYQWEAINLLDYINSGYDISNFMTVELFQNLDSSEQSKLLNNNASNFDLEEFMLNRTDCDGGIFFASENQSFMVDNFTTKYTKDGGEHGYTVEAIYSVIEGQNFEFNNVPWQHELISKGDICIQLCAGNSSPIWIPENISQFQYDQLVKLNDQIKQIYSNNKEYFDQYPMDFYIQIGTDYDNAFSSQNNLDSVLEKIKNNITAYENNIADVINPTGIFDIFKNKNNKSTYNISEIFENLDNVIIWMDQKYGTGIGIKQLEGYYYSNDSSLITKEGNCRDYVDQYVPKDILKLYLDNYSLKNMISSNSSSSITELSRFYDNYNIELGKYGVDQGIIESFCDYYLNGVKYNYEQAKSMLQSAINNGQVLPHFDKKGNQEYFRLKEKLMNMGFSASDASIIMTSLNDVGACSYASVCNNIFYEFRNNPDMFQEIFGYSMYTTVNGKETLNSAELLLDLYVFANSKENGGLFFEGNTIDSSMLSTSIDVFGRNILQADQQIYMSNDRDGRNVKVINDFIQSKSSLLEYRGVTLINSIENTITDVTKFNNYMSAINNGINQGYSFAMGIYYNPRRGDRIINMYSFDPTSYENMSTASWNEGGGHSVAITGFTADGLIVSSWGKKYLITYADLYNSGKYIISYGHLNLNVR